jgi:hypothetical protein
MAATKVLRWYAPVHVVFEEKKYRSPVLFQPAGFASGATTERKEV